MYAVYKDYYNYAVLKGLNDFLGMESIHISWFIILLKGSYAYYYLWIQKLRH